MSKERHLRPRTHTADSVRTIWDQVSHLDCVSVTEFVPKVRKAAPRGSHGPILEWLKPLKKCIHDSFVKKWDVASPGGEGGTIGARESAKRT